MTGKAERKPRSSARPTVVGYSSWQQPVLVLLWQYRIAVVVATAAVSTWGAWEHIGLTVFDIPLRAAETLVTQVAFAAVALILAQALKGHVTLPWLFITTIGLASLLRSGMLAAIRGRIDGSFITSWVAILVLTSGVAVFILLLRRSAVAWRTALRARKQARQLAGSSTKPNDGLHLQLAALRNHIVNSSRSELARSAEMARTLSHSTAVHITRSQIQAEPMDLRGWISIPVILCATAFPTLAALDAAAGGGTSWLTVACMAAVFTCGAALTRHTWTRSWWYATWLIAAPVLVAVAVLTVPGVPLPNRAWWVLLLSIACGLIGLAAHAVHMRVVAKAEWFYRRQLLLITAVQAAEQRSWSRRSEIVSSALHTHVVSRLFAASHIENAEESSRLRTEALRIIDNLNSNRPLQQELSLRSTVDVWQPLMDVQLSVDPRLKQVHARYPRVSELVVDAAAELLSNAYRHSYASQVTLSLRRSSSSVVIECVVRQQREVHTPPGLQQVGATSIGMGLLEWAGARVSVAESGRKVQVAWLVPTTFRERLLGVRLRTKPRWETQAAKASAGNPHSHT